MNLLSRTSRRILKHSYAAAVIQSTRIRTPTLRTFATMRAMDSIKVHNSLKAGAAVPFEPIQKGKVSWYACGPTVYDQSHLGHARNFVSTDIIRRILIHYFGFDVKFVMNITDVDDKIIIRARRRRLLDLEKKKDHTEESLSELWKAAFQAYAASNLPQLLQAEGPELAPGNYKQRRDAAYGKILSGAGTLSGEGKPGDAEAKIKMHVSNMNAAVDAVVSKQVLDGAEEIFLPYLDSLYKETIDTSDQTIFTDLTKHMEGEFFDDMDALNVLRPDVITRVTEYVPQIVSFVKQIADKGFAYESEGSVYFDIAAFEKAGNPYARLRPESRNDKSLQEEGEGSLSKNLGGKKGSSDFALWKKSKKGEPFWDSPWGHGRPGWHIECSVMASDVLGGHMDIHSGGIDLAFPHHDNELAQSEAYFCEHGHEHTWVNYFLHMGHLSIQGSKMSKSLKNFQTIKDALASNYTPRSMRIVFLLGRWNEGVEISTDMRTYADGWESAVNNFFTNVKALLADAGDANNAIKDGVRNLSVSESQPSGGLLADLEQAKKDLEAALVNSFDTPQALRVVADIIRKANIHISEHAADLDLPALEAVARWITKIVGILGLDTNANPPYDGLGWAPAEIAADVDLRTVVQPFEAAYNNVLSKFKALGLPESDSITSILSQTPGTGFESLVNSGVRDLEKLAMPYLQPVSKLRDELRRIASTTAPEMKKSIHALSDQIRDIDMIKVGVYLDDRTGGLPSLVKFLSPQELKALQEKSEKEEEAKRRKEQAKREQEKKEEAKWARAKIPPQDLFKGDARYSERDDKGIPTTDDQGNALSKKQRKRVEKEYADHTKLHEEWLAKSGKGAAA